jgi:hypothetical protein
LPCRPELEDLVVAWPAGTSGRAAWEEFIALDGVLSRIGDEADQRLAFQAAFPIYSSGITAVASSLNIPFGQTVSVLHRKVRA